MSRLARLLAACALALLATSTRAASPLEVARITPAGTDVSPGRQIVFQFDRPVVPLGRMSREAHEIPVRIQPRVSCRWRWLDTSALACDLPPGAFLAPGTRYVVEMDPGITALDGATLARALRHEFLTARPRVEWVGFETWLDATTPVLRVVFDQPVERGGVAAHLYFDAPGAPMPRVSARIAADHEDGLAVLAGGASEAQLASAALRASTRATTWLVAPSAGLPLDASIAVHVEAGVRGAGPEPGAGARSVVAFDTFPVFAFRGIGCTDAASRERIEVAPGIGTDGPGPCDPLAGVALLFSSPVRASELGAALTLAPALAGGREDHSPWEGARDWFSLEQPHARGRTYPVWMPERLRAFEGYRAAIAPGALRDAFGRVLDTGLEMRFGTAHRRPRLHLEHDVAVLEQGVDSEVPVYVTNLDAIDLAFRHSGSIGTHARRVQIPRVEDVSFAVPLGVREMLGGASGAVSGRLEPSPRDADRNARQFFAQVTPFAITVKVGHFGSLAWVTRMDDGSPVAGAALTVYEDSLDVLAGPYPGAIGPFVTDATGVARLPGSAVLDPRLGLLEGWRRSEPRLFVRVEKDGELGVLPLGNEFRVWTREVWPRRRPAFGHLTAWGTTAQGIYRAGDTIQYKLYVRHQDTHTLVPAPRTGYRLSVIDPRGEALLEGLAIDLDAFGAFAGEIAVPAGAAVGWYRFQLHSAHGGRTLDAFRVLVSDFTPAPFKVRTDLNGDAFEPGRQLQVTTTASLHAGGPYTAAPARITVRVSRRPLEPQHPLAARFRFDTGDAEGWRMMYQDEVALDARGERTLDLSLGDPGVQYGQLQVESAVSDDRGKRVAATAVARFAARDRFVGLRDTRWLHTAGEPAQVEYIVVDADGQPVADVPVALTLEREQVFSARVKSAGNSFEARQEVQWEVAGQCAGHSSAQEGTCEFVPASAGRYRITARVEDSRGRPHETTIGTWVQGAGDVVWQEPEDGALAIVAERARYAVGDTARFMVRNPFPGAYALVTLERYGILRSWTRRLEGSTPVIEFPVLPDDLPGFYLSVTVLSPRVSAPPPERGQLDLGKPAMRMGYVQVPVDDPYKRLDVAVTPSARVYRPRDTARIEFRVREHASGAVPASPVQLAVAVLDEAVFDLVASGSRNFDPYAGFYAPDGLDVVSYSLLTRLVGRQKFETKGASAGGDGGAALGLRDLFRFVSYWNPAVTVDATGRAAIETALPDNLTGWRVVAIAVTPGDRMGLGEGGFSVNKDLELRPVMPNRLSAGDSFRAGFTALNRTGSERTLELRIEASGQPLEATAGMRRELTLAPFARETAWLELRTSRAGTLRLLAHAGGASDGDAVEHLIEVHAPAPAVTAAEHGSIDGGRVEQPLLVPADVLPGSAEVALLASPTLLGNADGAFRHMRDYPYACWEQRLSKGVMASQFNALREYLSPALEWQGADSLPSSTLADAGKFQAPGGGMAFWVPEDGRVSPYLSAYTALAFTWLERTGHVPERRVRERLDAYLAEMMRRDVLPDFYSRGMASSVRAVALAALARRGAATPDDVLRHRSGVPHMSVFAKAMYLDAAWRTLGRHAAVDEGLAALLGHGRETGGSFTLAEPVDAGGRQLLDSPARANCAALSTLSEMARDQELGQQVAPLAAKLVRSVVATRGRRDHWENTQENVFCMAALADYARAFESSPTSLELDVSLDAKPLGAVRFGSRRDAAVTLRRALGEADGDARHVLGIEHRGTGRAYYTARLRYSLAGGTEPLDAGMSIRREYSVQRDGRWQLLRDPIALRRGELVRVDLYLSLPAPRHFVVVDDPVPGALEPVNRELATASVVDAAHGRFEAADSAFWHTRDDWRRYGAGHWSFYHRELGHDAARFYADYLPEGAYHLSYVAQVIAEGEFAAAGAHAEEMYDPDVFANGAPAKLVVGGARSP